jgi:hypothetical protein
MPSEVVERIESGSAGPDFFDVQTADTGLGNGGFFLVISGR